MVPNRTQDQMIEINNSEEEEDGGVKNGVTGRRPLFHPFSEEFKLTLETMVQQFCAYSGIFRDKPLRVAADSCRRSRLTE